jgi:predicted PurR-regulated permease PerM
MADAPPASAVLDNADPAPLADRGSLVPEWLANLAALGWRVIVVAGLGVVLWLLAMLLSTVTAAIAVAIVVSAALAPAVLRLRGRGRSKTAAAAIVWAAALVGISVVLVLLALWFIPYLGQVLARFDAGMTDLDARIAASPAPQAAQLLADRLGQAAHDSILEVVGSVAGSVASAITVLILATFLIFFMLRDAEVAWAWVFQGFAAEKREAISTAGRDALSRVGGYLWGTTALSGLIAITDFAFMVVLGVPLVVPLTVLVFLGGFIPYFGGIVTTAILLVVTLGAVGPAAAIALLVLIGIRNVFLGYGVRPTVYGRSVSLHPAIVLMVLPAGFQVAGVIGLFAAVPVTAVVFALARTALELVDPDPPPPLPGLVPAWLDRLAQWSWRMLVGIGLVGLVVAVFVTIPLVLLPIVLALILAATLKPLMAALVRRGRSRSMAAAATVGGTFLAVAGVLALSAAVLVEQAVAISNAAAAGADAADEALGGQLGLLTGAVREGGNQVVGTAASIARDFSGLAVVVVLGTLLAFYFLRDGGSLWGMVIGRARREVAGQVSAAAGRAFDVLGGYMVGTAVISFVGSGSQFVIMVVLGLPLALPVFVLSFFLDFIPYVGGFITTGIAFLITVKFGSQTDIVVMAVWTLVFNLVTGNIVGPLVYGRTVHLHPAVVLLAIPAAGAVAGILGMFLVVPAIGVVAATWRTVVAVMSARRASAPAAATDPPPGETDPPPSQTDPPAGRPFEPAPV